MLKEKPQEITLCTLEVVTMPNGEIISNGKTVGWYDDLKRHLNVKPAGAIEISFNDLREFLQVEMAQAKRADGRPRKRERQIEQRILTAIGLWNENEIVKDLEIDLEWKTRRGGG